jgi:hypothetical protein
VRKSFIVPVSVLAMVAFGGSAAPANAGKGGGSAPAPKPQYCTYNHEQPFYAWSDYEWYGLAPGANFLARRTPSGWLLKDASIVAGGNPIRPWSSDYSLYLKPGGYATTSAFCVDKTSPHSRMFAYTTTPNAAYSDGLKVEVIYTDAVTNKSVTKPVAVLKQQDSWNATEQFPLVGTGAANPKWDSTSRATVKYKFTAVNGTAWRIDDLFIDPKRH